MANPAGPLAQPTPPGQLTERDRNEIAYLAGLTDDELDKAVNEWTANPDRDGSGKRVFHSADLAPRVKEALRRLVHDAETKERAARNRDAKLQQNERKLRLSREKEALGQIVEAVRQQAAATSPRRQAEAVLGELFPGWRKRATALFEDGKTKKEVLALLRAQLAEERAQK